MYLAKTLDYRALLFAGSRWDGNALEWLAKRGSTVVAVGGDLPGAQTTVRYSGDDDPEIARSPRSSCRSSSLGAGGQGS